MSILSALGGNEAYQACCTAAGAGTCPQTLEVVGPGSASIISGESASITGIWRLSCENGARFMPQRNHRAPSHSDQGMVLSPMNELASACFDAACHLPISMCVEHRGGYARVVHCDARTAPGSSTWEAPSDPSAAVVIDGRVVKVRQISAATTPAPSSPRANPAASPPRRGDLDLSVPVDPPAPCVPKQSLRGPSNEQVDLGNDEQIQNQLAAALDHYRVAIGINQCNAFAWAALGEALLQADWAPGAQTALKAATRLMPSHFGAWTNLGRSEEQLERYREARSAYLRALEEQPGHPGAVEGLRRVDQR